jgi:putative SOS response-associated peptidase YedK
MAKPSRDLLSHFEADEVKGAHASAELQRGADAGYADRDRALEKDSLERRLLIARWGLVPSRAKDLKIGSKMINARSETILEKPPFRNAAIKRRALVPAEGYYEWEKTEDGKKIPTNLHPEKDKLLAVAGLYEWWPDPSLPEDDPDRWLLSCTILTTTAHDALGQVHDRAPVIVPGHVQGLARPGPQTRQTSSSCWTPCPSPS